jgi:hypothetical protein
MKRALLLLVTASLLGTGCLTRGVKMPVFDQGKTSVFLRSDKKWSETIPKGYGHPITISAARMAHILSRIDMRASEGDGKREPAIPLDTLYVIAEGMSKALAQADPNQEVVVMSQRHGKHWFLFDRDFLTSLVAYMKDDLLYVHVVRADWEIPNTLRGPLPEPRADEQEMKFHLVASEGMTLVNGQAVAVSWRDPIFRRATRTRILPGGRVVRREVLMESAEDAPAPLVSSDVLPGNLSADTLRKLADLEEQKTRGEVTQTEYTVMRNTILQADPAYSQ